jgi:hypothetical protein
MKDLNKYLRYQRKGAPKPPRQFEKLEASALFCLKCKKAVPVRKKLLLTLPEGDKYDYLCTECGSPVGSKISKEDTPIQFITK